MFCLYVWSLCIVSMSSYLCKRLHVRRDISISRYKWQGYFRDRLTFYLVKCRLVQDCFYFFFVAERLKNVSWCESWSSYCANETSFQKTYYLSLSNSDSREYHYSNRLLYTGVSTAGSYGYLLLKEKSKISKRTSKKKKLRSRSWCIKFGPL